MKTHAIDRDMDEDCLCGAQAEALGTRFVTIPAGAPARSLHQPYAGLMALGLKTIETRGERTSVRGRLVIAASLTFNAARYAELAPRMVREHGVPLRLLDLWCKPTGVALCAVHIIDCRPLVLADEPAALFFADKRWAWVTDPRKLELLSRAPVRGLPGTFRVPHALTGMTSPGGWHGSEARRKKAQREADTD